MIQHRAYVGIGSNLGDRERTLRDAFDALDALRQTRVAARSSIYVTAPVDPAGEQQDYYNAVAALDTGLAPHSLLAALQRIESDAGRMRQAGVRNTARTLDLDILLYDDLELDAPGLHIPHPRLEDRAFVLAPLAEIAPGCVTPRGRAVSALLARVADQRITRVDAPRTVQTSGTGLEPSAGRER